MKKCNYTKLQKIKIDECEMAIYNPTEDSNTEILIHTHATKEQELEIITNILNLIISLSPRYPITAQIQVIIDLELCKTLTNITFTDKQLEDIVSVWEHLNQLKVFKAIESNVDNIHDILYTINDAINEVYKYKNSFMGIVDTMANEYGQTENSIDELTKKLQDPNSLGLLKDILTKLG